MTSGGLKILSAAEAKRFVCSAAEESLRQAKRFCVALSGGSSMQILSGILKDYPADKFKDWHFFWADERCVRLSDSQSNYRLAKELLFDNASILPQNIHPINEELISNPEEAARDYQNKIEQFFEVEGGQIPRFDLVVLGIGEDGHTASLFPNSPLLEDNKRLVAEVIGSPKPPPHRITFTPKLINNAGKVLFITAGKEKDKIINRLQTTQTPTATLPATFILPQRDAEKYLLQNNSIRPRASFEFGNS
jgi:6-phosphogluconolactonase